MGRRKWDEQFLCPTLMEGHQMLSVSFSFPRTIERVRKGEWKATAPTFGLHVTRANPLHAEFALLEAVRAAAIQRLDPRPSTETTKKEGQSHE